MKSHQSRFMEKKIKKTPEGTKSFSNKSEEKTIIVTIVVALVILGALLVNLVVFTSTEKEPFSAIYYLDKDGTLENFPTTVILGQNSTFKLIVGVENQNGTTMDYLVKVNIDDGKSLYNPNKGNVTTTVDDDKIWESEVDIFLDTAGTNKIIFKLYARKHEGNEDYVFTENDFTGNEVFFSIEAIQP